MEHFQTTLTCKSVCLVAALDLHTVYGCVAAGKACLPTPLSF